MSEVHPKLLVLPEKWPLHYPDKATVEAVSLKLHDEDGMYQGNSDHYLSVGASALHVIEASRVLARIKDFRSILDFGSGAGRVTRWLRAAYPDARITTSDLRVSDLLFCKETFASGIWPASTDVESMTPTEDFDLIWVGSVLTHLAADKSAALLSKLVDWVPSGGLLIASFHGRFAYSWRNQLGYIDASCLPGIEGDYDECGFGYADYPNQSGYGISFCTPSWMAMTMQRIPGCQIILQSELAWDAHHDVLALKKIS